MNRLPPERPTWAYEQSMLIAHIRALLLRPNDPAARRRALDHLTEIFEDDGLEGIKP